MIKILLTFFCLFFTYLHIDAQEACTGRFREKVFGKVELDGNIIFSQLTLPGGGIRTMRYDVYTPFGDTAALRPLIVLWHGGAFVDAIKKNSPDIVTLAKDLAKMGYVVITPDYRGVRNLLSFTETKDLIKVVVAATLDGNDAICHILSEIDNGNPFRINKEEIFAGGVSAGGILGLHGIFLDRADELGPQFAEWAREVDNGRVDEVLGNKFCGNAGIIKGFFNVSGALVDTSFIKPTHVNFLHIHGTHDEFVPFDKGQPLFGITAAPDLYGSKPIQEKSLQIGIQSEFIIYEGGGHVPYLNLDFENLIASLNLINEKKYNECLTAISQFLFSQIECEQEEVITSAGNHSNISIQLYPNPALQYVQVDMPESRQWDIALHDLSGRIVKTEQFSGKNHRLSFGDLSDGLYILHITNRLEKDKSYIGKIVKTNQKL